jgi:hypothetical protein
MQNNAGANFGERNAKHQGDEVLVHGGFPWQFPLAIVLGNSPVAVSTISQSLGNVNYLTPDSSANSPTRRIDRAAIQERSRPQRFKRPCSGSKPSLIFQRSPDLSAWRILAHARRAFLRLNPSGE